jgi:leucyl/phenylalanyl-tRNA--protein transferase
VPVEPPPTPWAFPPADRADGHGVVGMGADLEPGTLLAAYRSGLFPMPVDRGGLTAWWSPDPRGVLPLDRFRVTRSMRRSARRFEVRIDTAFGAVVDGCRDPRRDGAWITPAIKAAYLRLHELGWAHSVETWSDDGVLVGGLYGVALGGAFAGESMFHLERDASKVALMALVDRLRDGGATLLDVQWTTEHLISLGAVDLDRRAYLRRLRAALELDVDPFAPAPPMPAPAAPSPGPPEPT